MAYAHTHSFKTIQVGNRYNERTNRKLTVYMVTLSVAAAVADMALITDRSW